MAWYLFSSSISLSMRASFFSINNCYWYNYWFNSFCETGLSMISDMFLLVSYLRLKNLFYSTTILALRMSIYVSWSCMFYLYNSMIPSSLLLWCSCWDSLLWRFSAILLILSKSSSFWFFKALFKFSWIIIISSIILIYDSWPLLLHALLYSLSPTNSF